MDKNMKKTLSLRATKAIHLLVSTAMFCLCAWLFYGNAFADKERVVYTAAGGFIFFILAMLLGRIYGIYSVGSSRVSYLIYSHGLTFLITDCIAYVLAILVYVIGSLFI